MMQTWSSTSLLLRGDGLTLLLDRGALHLLHTGVDLVLAGALLLLVHIGSLVTVTLFNIQGRGVIAIIKILVKEIL